LVPIIICSEIRRLLKNDRTKTLFNIGKFIAIIRPSLNGKITHNNEKHLKKANKQITDFRFDKIGLIFEQNQLPAIKTSLEIVLFPLISQRISCKKVEHANEVQSQVEPPNKLESEVIFVTYDSVLVSKVGVTL